MDCFCTTLALACAVQTESVDITLLPWMMTTLKEEAPANSVPAAAVRQKGQVLFRIIGRKGHVGGSCGGLTNVQAFPGSVDAYPRFLSMLQEDRMSGGEVKF